MPQTGPDLVEAVGYIAATLTTLAFFPQVIRTWRTRSAEDLSFAMLLAFSTGVLLWVVYGVAVRSWPLVAANVVTLLLSSVLIILQRRFRKPPSSSRPATDRRPSQLGD